jgi:hypothetical protein
LTSLTVSFRNTNKFKQRNTSHPSRVAFLLK